MGNIVYTATPPPPGRYTVHSEGGLLQGGSFESLDDAKAHAEFLVKHYGNSYYVEED